MFGPHPVEDSIAVGGPQAPSFLRNGDNIYPRRVKVDSILRADGQNYTAFINKVAARSLPKSFKKIVFSSFFIVFFDQARNLSPHTSI